MASILDRCVQLIVQSNDCCLMPDYKGSQAFKRTWDMSEFSKNPEVQVFLRSDRNAFCENKLWENHYENRIPQEPYLYHQKIKTLYLTEAGYMHGKPYVFCSNRLKNNDLYLQFINLESKEALETFIKEKEDFCIFPNKLEQEQLQREYSKSTGKKFVAFYHTMKNPLPKELRIENNQMKKKIRKINIDYLWEKKKLLQEICNIYRTGKLNFLNLSFLCYSMEQVSEILIDKKYYDIKKIEDGVNDKKIKDERTRGETLGDREINNAGQLVPGYRVFGHFAFCCLQLFLLIKSEKSVSVCNICKKYFVKKHKKEMFCSEKCRKKGASKRSLKHYNKNK